VTARLRPGQMFGRYEIVRLIGEGGMGAVYEATRPGLKRRFAIKTLLPEIAEREDIRTRFLREGEAATSINHPNVVAVSDVGTEDGIPFLVMEFFEGQTLGELLASRGALDAEESLALLLPVVSAIATGHERGVINRDLKPDNIFLAKGPWGDRIPKVLDFGVSKLTTDESKPITRTMSVLGTAAYMSPEQARGAKLVGFPSDQYSLGLILYEMLTGKRAFPGENRLEILYNVTHGAIRPARLVNPAISAEVEAVLTRMLRIAPTDRFSSLQECGRALLPLADAKTRMAMANAFTTAESEASATSGSAAPPQGVTSEFIDHLSPAPRGGGTVELPAPADTTLGQSAVEARAVRREAPAPSRSGRRWGLVVGLGAVAMGGGLFALKSNLDGFRATPAIGSDVPAAQPVAMSAPSVPFVIRAVPPEAELALDDRPPTRGRLEVMLPLAGSSHHVRASAAGYVPKDISFGAGESPPSEIRLERVAPISDTVTETPPESSVAHADGHEPASAPHSKRPVTAEHKHVIKVVGPKDGPAAPMVAAKPPAAAPTPDKKELRAPEVPPAAQQSPKRGSNNAVILSPN